METKYERDGLHVHTYPCLDPRNPREDGDANNATLVLFHRKYQLGDKGHQYHTEDYRGWGEMRAAIVAKENPVICLPVYMMDHSGLSFSTSPFSCQWDSGQVGWAFVPASSGLTAEQAKSEVEYELAEYALYLEGGLLSGEVQDMLTGERLEGWDGLSEKALQEEIDNFFTQRGCAATQEAV